MKPIIVLFLAAMLMASAIHATPVDELVEDNNNNGENALNEEEEPTFSSLRGIANRFLVQKSARVMMTCNTYPRICRAKGSPGLDCCKNMCVNVNFDILNCGKCGKKCKYSEICCKGKCVNPMKDKKHCGGCNNQCSNGNSCLYGLCNYA